LLLSAGYQSIERQGWNLPAASTDSLRWAGLLVWFGVLDVVKESDKRQTKGISVLKMYL
jgi:hypothetical protein